MEPFHDAASPLIDLTEASCPFRWDEVFPRPGPVELEIGSGKGRFLVGAAERWPDRNFLGVEAAGRYLRRSVERVRKSGLPNIRLARTDARDVLCRWLSPSSLQRIHVYFPDPWPKKRHVKRRIINGDFTRWAAAVLAPGGEILIGTDHEGYVEWVHEVMGGEGAGLFEALPWEPDAESWIFTNYAIKWSAQGRRLFWLRYALTPGPAGPPAGSFQGQGSLRGGPVVDSRVG